MCVPYDHHYQEIPGLKMTSVYAGYAHDRVSGVYPYMQNTLTFSDSLLKLAPLFDFTTSETYIQGCAARPRFILKLLIYVSFEISNTKQCLHAHTDHLYAQACALVANIKGICGLPADIPTYPPGAQLEKVCEAQDLPVITGVAVPLKITRLGGRSGVKKVAVQCGPCTVHAESEIQRCIVHSLDYNVDK